MRFCDDLRGREAVKAANSASTYCSTTQPIEEGKAHNMTLIDCNYIEVPAAAPNNNVARVNPPTRIHLVGVPSPLASEAGNLVSNHLADLGTLADSKKFSTACHTFFTQSLFSYLFHLFSVFWPPCVSNKVFAILCSNPLCQLGVPLTVCLTNSKANENT